MLKEAIFHEPDSNYCYPISNNEITLRLRVSKKDNFEKVSVIYGCKYDYYIKQQAILMNERCVDELYRYYEVTIKLTDVRFVYVFKLEENNKVYYFCEDGILDKYDFSLAYFNCFQYPFINDIDTLKKIDWLKDRVFYQIFVDRFNQGDFNKEQAYINLKIDEIPKPSSFYGGDLKGIIAKLNYLNELGVNALYLTPIFKSKSNHKYDIADYYQVDNMFGSKEDLKELVDKAHKLGIRVVLDAVFNHCSSDIYQFQDVIKNGKNSKYFDWFIIHGDKVDQKKVNYEIFSICDYLPKLNSNNKEVRNFLIEIGKYYVKNFDIDGWRLDVADELSHVFWREFRLAIKEVKQDCFLVAENWHNSYPFLKGDQFDSIMNYAFTKALLDYLAFKSKDALETSYKLNDLLLRNSDVVNDMMLNLIDTHDTDRFYTSCNKDIDLLTLSLAILFMFKGIPGLYYGIEIPLEGGYDPDNRRPMNFNKINYESTYFKTLKELISLRKSNKALAFGSININVDRGMLVIERENQDEKLTLYVNNTGKALNVNFEKVILKYNYENFTLADKGFVIVSGGNK